ncbi:MAG: hypothetical protein ACK5II_12495 [Paracoccus sp. (in: a-proteobacteria)]
MALLILLDEAGILDKVTTIHMRCGIEVLFEGAANEAELLEWLTQRGFDPMSRENSDSVWSTISLSAHRRQLREQGEAIAAHTKNIEKLKATIAGQEATIQQHVNRIAMLVEQEKKVRDEASAAAELHARHKAEREQLRAEHSEMMQSMYTQTTELQALQTDYSNLHDEKQLLEELIHKLTPRLREAVERLHIIERTEAGSVQPARERQTE